MVPTVPSETMEFHNSSYDKDIIPGTLNGHLLPVEAWGLAGLWYLIMSLKNYYDCKIKKLKFRSSVEIPYRFEGVKILPFLTIKTIPAAAYLKILAGGVYFFHDIIADDIMSMETMNRQHHFQHDTIAITFIMSGFVDLMSVWPKTSRILPVGMDYILFSLTFFTEVMQFLTHLHGRTPVDVRLHQIQALIAGVTVIALAVEACLRKRPEFPVIRATLMILQSTWMLQLSMILYHPLGIRPWDLHSEDNVSLLSMMFVWHIILLSWLALFINLVFAWCYTSALKKKKASQDVTPLMIMSS